MGPQQSCCSAGMMQPRCGTGGDKSGRLYFCRPISHHSNDLYPQSPTLYLALHLTHLCCHCLSLSLSPRVLLCALVLTHALHIQRCPSLSVSISVLQASLRPAYLLSLIAESEISQQQRRTIIQEPFFIFSPVLFHPSFVCALLFFFPPHRS